MNNTLRYFLTFAVVVAYFSSAAMIDSPLIGESMLGGVAEAQDADGSEPQGSEGADGADAVVPYNHTFTLTAYYSPLPGQLKYVTGSYSGDIRLNGRGTNGADGTPVYAGMVAAPKKYDFGTKLFIPGIGMTAVHDRGGAIVEAATDENGDGEVDGWKHDRLDIWMGYGDKGLKRALDWGLRTLEVTVYGIDDTVEENVTLSDFSPDEKFTQEYYYIPEYYNDNYAEEVPQVLFKEDLWYLDKSDDVKELQEYLTQLGYFKGITNGYFGDETRMAIYLFQKDKGIVRDITDLGAGHFGLQTRQELEKAVVNRKKTVMPKTNMGEDDADADSANVLKLQKLLNLAGYSVKETGKYDAQTTKAVFKFQKDNKIVKNENELGAGYFGPKTSSALSAKLDKLVKDGKATLPVAHANEEVEALVESKAVLTPYMHENLSLGSTGPTVKRLQKELKSLNLLRKEPTGTYDETTEHAVFKLQQVSGLVSAMEDDGAGVFGPQTREKLNNVLASKNYYNKLIAEKAAK